MQPIPCSEARVVVFGAYNPLDLANEENFWLKDEGESMNIVDWSYRMKASRHEKEQYIIHSMALLCRKNETEP